MPVKDSWGGDGEGKGIGRGRGQRCELLGIYVVGALHTKKSYKLRV